MIVNKENIDFRKASITNVSKNRQSVIKLANTSRLGLRVVQENEPNFIAGDSYDEKCLISTKREQRKES